MTARMEKVREALRWMVGGDRAAALAEVEETEARLEANDFMARQAAILVTGAEARAEAAEGEADRLKAALEHLAETSASDVSRDFARAALAPADRNTT